MKASVGRWQKGKDILWYTRGKDSEDAAAQARAEIAAVKAAEERAMAEALGLKPKTSDSESTRGVSSREMERLLRRANTGGPRDDDGTRTRGIGGIGVSGTSSAGGPAREVMAGVGIDEGRGDGAAGAVGNRASVGISAREAERLIAKANKRRRKDEEREAKRLKKRAKKEAKKERRGGGSSG